jgi:hypothetical protein
MPRKSVSEIVEDGFRTCISYERRDEDVRHFQKNFLAWEE